MNKDEVIKILKKRQYFFKRNGGQKFEVNEIKLAIDIIQRLMPPDYFECENSEGGIKEIIIDKNHAINFTICNHVRGEIVVTDTGIKAVCKICGTYY